jgi:hypothetical protein
LKDLIYFIWRKINSASVGHNVTPASVDDNRTLIDDYMASTVNKTASFNDDRLMDKVSDSSVGGNQERKIHCSVILICRMVKNTHVYVKYMTSFPP